MIFAGWPLLVTTTIVICSTPMEQSIPLNRRLIIACHALDRKSVVEALREGADVNARYGRKELDALRTTWTSSIPATAEGWTPLLALLNASYPPSRTAASHQGSRQQRTSDETATRDADRIAIFELLRSHGCDIEMDDGFGSGTALIVAIKRQLPTLAKLLIESGADVNAKTKPIFDGTYHRTPLHCAYWSKEITSLLLKNGANVDAKDSDDRRPCDVVVILGKPEVVELYHRMSPSTGRAEKRRHPPSSPNPID
jgi:Ankyrin repeats (3 copies)